MMSARPLRLLPVGFTLSAALVIGGLLTTAHSHPQADTPPATPAPVPMYRGLAVQLSDGRDPVGTYSPLLSEIAGMGANAVLLSTAARMEHARSQAIFVDARETPSSEEFVALIRRARELSLHVIVMPIVLLKHPRGSEWRGVIEPPDWTAWWEEYRRLIEYFADIAREGGAEALIVGSELISTEKNTAEWLRLIAAARQRFPGRLGYSANWDHYRPIQFWDKLDFVGMTSYYTLSRRRNPTVEEIVRCWEPIRTEILTWIQRINRPLVLTEVGWCSQEGAAMAPWNYYQNQKATPAGHEEQRRLYEAFLRVWEGTPGLSGVIWWEWTTAPGGPEDFGYTPRDKPAEQILRQWFERTKAQTQAQSSP